MTPETSAAGHQKWEVQIVSIGLNHFDVDKWTTRMGEEGWEPWTIVPVNGGYDLHFKRKKIQDGNQTTPELTPELRHWIDDAVTFIQNAQAHSPQWCAELLGKYAKITK